MACKELMEAAKAVEDMLLAAFNCDCMDEQENVLDILLPYRTILIVDGKRWFDPAKNIPYLRAAHSMNDDEFMGSCLNFGLKSAFGCAQIANVVNLLFFGHIVRAQNSM